MIKRFAINFLIIFMTFLGVIYGYTQSFSLSKYDRVHSYAEADNWTSCDTSDLVTAFRYYCKSRNLALEGSVADALTSFTTSTFNNICSTLGIDPTQLQAELKKTTSGNLGLRFLFSQTGITAYNRIFAEFLQNNDLQVGESVDNKVVYSGKYFTDLDGNKCLVYYVNDTYCNSSHSAVVSKLGTYYKYDYLDLSSMVGSSANYNVNSTQTFNYPVRQLSEPGLNPFISFATFNSANVENQSLIQAYGLGTNGFPSGLIRSGHRAIIYNTSNEKLYFGHFLTLYNRSNDNPVTSGYYWYCIAEITDNSDNTDITVDTPNNTVINNNTYNNKYVIIYNGGDTYISDDDDEPLPTTPPGGGGGGGDNPGQSDPTPSGPDNPDWQTPHGHGTIGSDGTFDFDIPFSLPNLNIDWSLKDIGHKFPFCIPGDIVSFYQTLAVEPRAPSIDAHIPLGSFYDWHFVADFSQYDRWAVIIRAVEYVGFVIGLIYFTVRMVKG